MATLEFRCFYQTSGGSGGGLTNGRVIQKHKFDRKAKLMSDGKAILKSPHSQSSMFPFGPHGLNRLDRLSLLK